MFYIIAQTCQDKTKPRIFVGFITRIHNNKSNSTQKNVLKNVTLNSAHNNTFLTVSPCNKDLRIK